MPVRLTMLLVAAVAAILAAAGCGGDDDASGDSPSTEVTTSSLTKAQYIEQADAACTKEGAKLLSRITEYSGESGGAGEGTPQYAELVEAAFLPTYEAQLAAVQRLGAPSGQEKQVEAMLTRRQEAIEELEDQGVESYGEVEQAFADADDLMYDFGLRACIIGQAAEGQG